MLASITKGEAVYREMRRRVLTGSLPPGTSLNQLELAAEFGVSPTPIREALRRLEGEGLMEVMAHATVLVAPLKLQEFDELYTIRAELDSFAATLAALHRSKHDLAAMRAGLKPSPDGTATGRLEKNRRFHRAVYSAGGNAELTSLLDQLWDRTDRYRIILVSDETGRRRVQGAGKSDREHRAIAAAVTQGDPDEAARLTKSHVQLSHGLIRQLLTDSPNSLNSLSQATAAAQ